MYQKGEIRMRYRTLRLIRVAAIFLSLLLITNGAVAGPAEQEVSGVTLVGAKISYQGVLTDASGSPLNGSHNLKFELYDAASAGIKLWEQTKTGVQIQNGLFTVQLGITPDDFNGQPLWLAITVDGQLLSPRQELLPVPYALSLRPGAVIRADQAGPVLSLDNQGGNGVAGSTTDDTAYQSAGVYGWSAHDRTFGVLGRSDMGIAVEGSISSQNNTNSAVVGYNTGGGSGVEGYSVNAHGVYGHTISDSNANAGVSGYASAQSGETYGVYGQTDSGTDWATGVYGYASSASGRTYGIRGKSDSSGGRGMFGWAAADSGETMGVLGRSDSAAGYGGYFVNTADGAALYADGGSNYAPDLIVGGSEGNDDGLILSEPSLSGSDLVLVSNDAVVVSLDENDDEEGHFVVYNGTDTEVFSVDEGGNVDLQGDLSVTGYLNARGLTALRYDVNTAGLLTIQVPDFCIDGMCSVFIWSDATMGAFNPGFLWPVYYLQDSADNSWIGGPSLMIAGVGHSDGLGVNGDGHEDWVHLGGQTSSGGYVSVLDDSAAENSPNLWTIDFNPVPGEITQASIIICPYSSPVAP